MREKMPISRQISPGADGTIPGSNGKMKLCSDDNGVSAKIKSKQEDGSWADTGFQQEA
jgi:hypothetical protein